MKLTKQRSRELRMMFESVARANDPQTEPDWEYLELVLETLRDALSELGYRDDALKIDIELALPRSERCDAWDMLEATSLDFDM